MKINVFSTDPTTVAAAKLVDVAFFASVLRDFYNGTKYDMAGDGNLAAGPWGDPDRFGTWSSPVKGSWERSIGVYRTAYAHVTQVLDMAHYLFPCHAPFLHPSYTFALKTFSFALQQANSQFKGSLKGFSGITWFASDKPSTSVFLPFLVAPLPVAFSIGQPSVMDKNAAYWLFRCACIPLSERFDVRLPNCSLTLIA
jgi:dipeptidase